MVVQFFVRTPLVLEDINLKIEKGQKIAFVGESGSGKTTLSKLLLHLYASETGDILINGNNIEDIGDFKRKN